MSRAPSPEAYEGLALLRKLSRRAMENCPPYMCRADFVHAGWLSLSKARDSGKPWGYAKKAAWGAMMNELSVWIGVPPRGADRVSFIPLSATTKKETIAEPPRPTPSLPDSVRVLIPRLARRQRECIGLYLEGNTLTEIGALFSISPSNVLTHLKAGCDVLKELVREASGPPPAGERI